MTEHTPFFILGHPRSGTTALAKLVNNLPGTACLYHEGNVLFRLFQTLQRKDILNEPIDQLVCDFIVTARHNLAKQPHRSNKDKLSFTKSAITNLAKIYEHHLRKKTPPVLIYEQISRHFFNIYADQSNTTRIGDKVPDFLFIPDHIVKPHPNGKVIHITRDPRAIIHSALIFNQSCLHLFAVPSAFAMAITLQLKDRLLKKVMSDFPNNRYLPIEHEELRKNPEIIQQKLHTFFSISRETTQTQQPKVAANIKQWQKDMATSDVSAIEAVYHICEEYPAIQVTNIQPYWLDKALAISYLLDSPDDKITQGCKTLTSVFKGTTERTELSLILQQLADHAHKRGQFNRAKEFYEVAVIFNKYNPVLWYKYGCLCFDMKELEYASECIINCRKLCPNSRYYSFLKAKNYLLYGLIKNLLHQTDKMVFYLKKALQIKPDFLLPRELLKLHHEDVP